MPRYSKQDIDVLSQVDIVTVHYFKTLTPTIQWQIIDLIRETSKNSRIPKQDRKIAEARYKQFRAVAKKRPKKRRRG